MTTIVTANINYQSVLALPSATVNEIVKKSTVRIDGAASGSGVIVAKDDLGYVVLTNRHVIEEPGEYQIITSDGKSYQISDTQELTGADLALIFFDSDENYSPIARGNSDSLVEGQKIYIAGYPGSQQVASNRTYRFMSESLIGFLAPADIKDSYELIYSGAPVPGMSGSPIVNEEGQLIGIYGLTDIDFSTGASYLYGIPFNTALKIAARSGIDLNSGQTNVSQPAVKPTTTTPGTTANNAGFEVIGSAEVNNFVIPETVYTGECPGRKLDSQEAMFFSNTTNTAPDRRVLITNVSRGLKRDPLPYADREYDEGQVSEQTEVTLGTEHEKRNFVLLAGKNQLEYEIVQIGDNDLETVLETGTFTAVAEKSEQFVERNKEPQEETYCPDDKKYCDKDERKVRTVYKCPLY